MIVSTERAKIFMERKRKQFERELQQGKLVTMKDIGRKGTHGFLREAWTFMVQYNLPQKVFVLERLVRTRIDGDVSHRRTRKIGEVEYRIGYYIVGKNGFLKGKWAWGQFCPLIPAQDLQKFLAKARREGTLMSL